MTRKEIEFPFGHEDMAGFLKNAWENGLLDEYSNNHFLIEALEGRITELQWKDQLINNDQFKLYLPTNGKDINYAIFSNNFIINLSSRLSLLQKTFGEKPIQEFVRNQLAAGKKEYDRDAFFQALSEIEILSFYAKRHRWTNAAYEPPISGGKTNPEASFQSEIECSKDGARKKVKINIEVKTPQFPNTPSNSTRVLIPGVLLTEKGKSDLSELSKAGDYKLLMPRVTKLIDFINSAVTKFDEYSDDEINLLYINWSYSDFPSNGFLEAWSLLTNEANGLLTHPSCAKKLNLRTPLSEEANKKISAVIVYSSSLEQLMFSDFTFSWVKSAIAGPHFRMFVIDEKLRNAEINDESTLLFNITGMNPDIPRDKEWQLLVNNAWDAQSGEDDKAADCALSHIALEIIEKNILT